MIDVVECSPGSQFWLAVAFTMRLDLGDVDTAP